ncbi:hypothetical protein ACMYQ1_18455 [Shewanella oncorhynchi]|uniref:hypothetical protein n=1 Tax=Shewanella oncorhynchi TaxID=2726434 RepID=UPI0039EF2B69
MGLPVTVYRYTDAGAPQLTSGTPSEWIAILKACLVDGYGAKAGLGWTLEFENAGQYKAAFRNSVVDGGTGGYVQFWSSTGGNAANTGMNFQTADSMSALDSFTKAGYGRQLSLTTGMRGWEIIGTSRGFYIISHFTTNLLNGITTSSVQINQHYFIGDIESHLSNDQGVFTIVSTLATQSNQYSTSSTGIVNNTQSLYCRLYAADGGTSSFMYSASKMVSVGSASLDGNAESLGLNHVMTPLVVTGANSTSDVNGVLQNNSLVMPYCRGIIPGLYISTFAGYRNENWPTELTRNEVQWVLLRSYFYTGYWVKTGTWYD